MFDTSVAFGNSFFLTRKMSFGFGFLKRVKDVMGRTQVSNIDPKKLSATRVGELFPGKSTCGYWAKSRVVSSRYRETR